MEKKKWEKGSVTIAAGNGYNCKTMLFIKLRAKKEKNETINCKNEKKLQDI